MKKAIKLTLAVVLVMGATSLFAQKFGRINTQEIIMAMPETKTMQENMDTFAKELSDNIETMNVEFNTKLQDFQKNYNTFSDAIKEVKEKELNDMQTRTREFQERAQQDYQKKQNELLRSSTRRKAPSTRKRPQADFWSWSTRRRDRWLTSTRLR